MLKIDREKRLSIGVIPGGESGKYLKNFACESSRFRLCLGVMERFVGRRSIFLGNSGGRAWPIRPNRRVMRGLE